MSKSSHIFLTVVSHTIGCIFFTAALFLLYQSTRIFTLVTQSSNWVATPATVLSAQRIDTPSTSKRTSVSSIDVTYTYQYAGTTYTSKRLDFTIGSNNFSNKRLTHQMRMLSERQADSPTSAPSSSITAYVNPNAPSESVIDRSVPIQWLAFGAFFILFPCFIGVLWGTALPYQFLLLLDMEHTAFATFIYRLSTYTSFFCFSYTPAVSLLLFYDSLTFGTFLVFALVLLSSCFLFYFSSGKANLPIRATV